MTVNGQRTAACMAGLLLLGLNACTRPRHTAPAEHSPATENRGQQTMPASAPKPLPKQHSCSLAPVRGPLEPCARDSAEHREALDLLQTFDRDLRALPVDADPTDANARLCRIRAHRCFEILRGIDPSAEAEVADSVLALKRFWGRGGRSWLEAALELAPSPDEGQVYIGAPPTMLPTFSLETSAEHPLSRLFCSLGDGGCGAETAGWLLRARRAVERRWLRENFDERRQACREKTAKTAEDARLAHWYSCVAEIGRADQIPHGRFRAPSRGWLVLSGVRGHYEVCDGVRAYDLETGAVFVAEWCSQPWDPGGLGEEERVAGVSAYAGRASVANLREFALLLLLSGEAVKYASVGTGSPLPEGVPHRFGDRSVVEEPRRLVVHTSDETMLPYELFLDGDVVASGELRWPRNDNRPLRDHAVRLLQVVEGGIERGCAPVRLPAALPLGKPPVGVSAVDPGSAQRLALWKSLRSELRRVGARKPCR